MSIICGAKTRAGTPCQEQGISPNGRCHLHGGLATGPTTEAGKEQARINGKRGGRPRKSAGGESESGKPNHMGEMSKDVLVMAVSQQRCADCRNLSANWVCQAAARGEIEGGQDFRPALGEKRNCSAFSHWKTQPQG
jgi:hypothetical protein